MPGAMPPLLENCEVRVFRWNQALPRESISPGYGLLLWVTNTKTVLISKTEPKLEDVIYKAIPQCGTFNLKFLSSPENLQLLISKHAIQSSNPFSRCWVDDLTAKVKDYLTNNFVFNAEASSPSCNEAAAPWTVIVVEVYQEMIMDECDHLQDVTVGDGDFGYSIDDIVDTFIMNLKVPSSYNDKRIVANEELGLIQVPALENFARVVINDDRKIEEAAKEEKCAICLEPLWTEKRDKFIRKTSCSHVFHGDCLGGWLSTKISCPICRSTLH